MSEIDNLKEQAKDYFKKNEYEKALDVLQQIVRLDPQDHEMWHYLSLVYFDLKNYQKSEESINKALALESENTDYILQFAYLKNRVSTDESTKLFKKILELDPGHPDANIIMGAFAFDEGRYEDAVKYLETGMDEEPDGDDLEILIECYLNLMELEKAGERLKQYVKYDIEGEALEKRNYLLVKYFIEKAMDTWTGSETDENGDTIYFPESEDQIEDAENYLDMAEDVGTTDEYFLEKIAELKNVIAANKNNSSADAENSDEQRDNDFEDLPENDKNVWNKLEEIFNLWSAFEDEDGSESRWPSTHEEIRASEKIFREIKKNPPKNESVKARLKELKEVMKSSKKRIPNYTFKFVRALVISIIVTVGIIIAYQLQGFSAPEFEYNPADWILKNNTHLEYDAFAGELGTEKKHYMQLRAGTQVIPLSRMGRSWMQVETEKGERGYIQYRNFTGSDHAIVEKDYPLYIDYKKRTVKDSLRLGENVTILGYQKEGKEFNPNLARVRKSNGKTGLVPTFNLEIPFMNNVPKLSGTYKYPTSEKCIENRINNDNLIQLEEKYGPASSVLYKGKKKTAYFRQIQVVKGDEKFTGILFTLDENNKAVGFELNKARETSMVDDLPLAETIRNFEPVSMLSYYDAEGIHIQWWEDFKDMNWFTTIIGWIVQVILMLVMAVLFFSLPRLLINPVMVLISNTRLFGNGLVLVLNFLVYGFASYAFFVWMAVSMNQIFTPLIFAIPAFILWWYLHRNNINYNRCPSCHTMNIGIDKGSRYQGQTSKVSYESYDVYTGSTETDTTITRHYERERLKKTKYTKHYTDFRECIRCGYNWGVAREESAGESSENY